VETTGFVGREGGTDHLKSLTALGEGAMELGHPIVIIHHQDPDHVAPT
jgi:hypothetical protein